MPPTPKHRGPRFTRWAFALMLLGISTPAVAQIPGFPPGVRPTPEQAQQLLESRPDLAEQLKQRIQQ